MDPEDGAQAGNDFAQRDLGLHGIQEARHEVVRSPGRTLDRVQRAGRAIPVPPAPEGPVSSTGASEGATCSASVTARCMAGLS